MNAMRLTGSAPSLRQHEITAPTPSWRRPDHVVLETCVEDVEGVRISARAGADRAELGDNLTAAGTTPSIGTIEAAIFAAAEQVEQRRAQAGAHWADKPEAAAPFGLRILIRPRGGSFVYTADEGRAMIADVRRIASLALEMAEFTRPQATGGGRAELPPAVDLGFVVGALTEDGVIDRGLVRLLVDMSNGAPVTFHRAFDHCRDTVEAYGDLEGLGVRYVLTSGAAQTAADGLIQSLVMADEVDVWNRTSLQARQQLEGVAPVTGYQSAREYIVRSASASYSVDNCAPDAAAAGSGGEKGRFSCQVRFSCQSGSCPTAVLVFEPGAEPARIDSISFQ